MRENIFLDQNKGTPALADYMSLSGSGRQNMGSDIPVFVYRMMEYSLQERLIEKYGKEEQVQLFREAGFSAGEFFARTQLDLSLDFPAFLAHLQKRLEELKLGILRMEKLDEQSGSIVLTIAEDADCSGLPLLGDTVCNYDEGLISGILSAYSGKSYEAIEVDCWATGDRVCRFEAKIRE